MGWQAPGVSTGKGFARNRTRNPELETTNPDPLAEPVMSRLPQKRITTGSKGIINAVTSLPQAV
jgi:hypothetical protein